MTPEGYPTIVDWAEFDSYLGYPKLTLNGLNDELSWLVGKQPDIGFFEEDRIRTIADADLHHEILRLRAYQNGEMKYLEQTHEYLVEDGEGQRILTKRTITTDVSPLSKANELFCAIVDLRKDTPDFRKAAEIISSRRVMRPNGDTTVGRNHLGTLLRQLALEE